jgi:hypothetical protein
MTGPQPGTRGFMDSRKHAIAAFGAVTIILSERRIWLCGSR